MPTVAPCTITKPFPIAAVKDAPSCRKFDFSFGPAEGLGQPVEWGMDVPVFPFNFHFSPSEIQYYVTSPEATVSTGDVRISFTPETEIDAAMAGLRTVVNTIRAGRLSPALPGLDDLFARAVGFRGRPADIEEWVRQLASDVGELAD